MKRLVLFSAALAALVGCASKRAATRTLEGARPAVEAAEPAERPSKEDTELLAAVLKGSVLSFDFDSAYLTESSRRRLQKVADVLRPRPWATVKVSGHCDERGTAEYNLALGHRRAEAARAYLLALGVHPDAVQTVSYGAELPAEDGHSEESWAANRRDELEPVDQELLGQAEPLASED